MTKRDDLLQQYWGYKSLRPVQKKIVKAIMKRDADVFAILSTGYGKSICYQLPFLINDSKQCVFVISPLIALMKDQESKLKAANIPVAIINSTLSQIEKQDLISCILLGENMIIYVTPEFIVSNIDFMQELYNQERLFYVAVDEAHCVSTWGNDFRSDYKKLNKIKLLMPNLMVLAFTATATERVKEDICVTLFGDEYYQFTSSLDRPNLYIECVPQSKTLRRTFDPYTHLFNQKVIVYVRTRNNTEKLEEELSGLGIKCSKYHAGLGLDERNYIQEQFCADQIDWVIATIAFGMGIDAKIKAVIHYGAPKDLDSYYQEIGRAGRDGTPADCILLHSKSDMSKNRLLLKANNDPELRKYNEKQLHIVEQFIRTNECRRKILLKYFDEEYTKDNCEGCDNCKRQITHTTECYKAIRYPAFLLKAFLIQSRIYSGATKIVDVMVGSKKATIKQYHNSQFFGSGLNYKRDFWAMIIEILIHNEYLTEKPIPSGFGVVLEPSSKAYEWYVQIQNKLNQHKGKVTFKTFAHLNAPVITYNIPNTCNKINDLINNRTIDPYEQLLLDSAT
jgi:RecQ family ATP-dependent DNA helicase